MKRVATLLLLSLLFPCLSYGLLAATISSVPAGGDWTTPATWVGGVVPGPNDDVIINGTVNATTTTVRSVTVSAGATLTGMGGPQWLTITSILTNNGRMVINAGNWSFVIYCHGTVINNGVWRISGLEFKNNTQYAIGGTGLFEGGNILKADSNAILRASTDLRIGCDFNLTGQNWSWTRLDMQGHTLILDGASGSYRAGSILGAIVDNVREIHVQNGGYLENTLMRGTITLTGTVAMSPNVTLQGDVTNEDTLTITGGPKSVYIRGTFTNNGVIVTNKDNWSFTLEIDGDILNNGVWNPSHTKLISTNDVTIAQTPGHWFEGNAIDITDTLGVVIAASDLEMRAAFSCSAPNWAWTNVDMRNYTLTLDARRGSYLAGETDRLFIRNVRDVVMHNNGALKNVSLYGDVRFRGLAIIGPNTSVYGSLTNLDTMRGAGGPNYLNMYGPFRNEGFVTWHPDRWGFIVQMHGDFYEAGLSENMFYNMITDDQIRRISGPVRTRFAVNYNISEKKGGSVDVIGETRTNVDLTITSGSVLNITSGSHLRTSASIFPDGIARVNINGALTQERSIKNAAADLNLFTGFIRIPAATGIDSLEITCRSNQVPPTFASAVKRWWTVNAFPEMPSATATVLRLYLGDAPLKTNTFKTLQVYHSADSGQTWRQITTDLSIRRDSIGNWIECSDAPLYGSFLLSSRPDPYTVQPGILVNIVGSDAIRIGAPNRLTFVATNVGPSPTLETIMPIYLGSQLHIIGAEITMAGGGKRTLNKEAATSGSDDSSTMFLLAPLEPGEQAMVDLLITADPNPNEIKNGDNVQIEPVTMIVGGTIICWVGGKVVGWVAGKAIDYVGDKATESIQLTDAERAKYAQALGVTSEQVRIKKTKEGWVVWGAKELGNEATRQMTKVGLPIEIAGAVGENIHKKVAPSLRQRIFNWFYKETGLIKPDQPVPAGQRYVPQVSGIARKQGRAVTSRDPNEKVGITGIGTNGFLGAVCPMIYQIKFENVKTAEAAAYKIVVVDTLDANVMDINTVRMLRTSHPGATFTVANNVLRWEWIGIDLPPNVTPPEGEGYVEFEVALKTGLASGTQIRNRATITFDLNDAIMTNTWLNTLDFDPPVTQQLVVKLATSDSVDCSFLANDGSGSGAEQSSIFIADGDDVFHLGDVLPYTGESMRIAIPSGSWSTMRFYALSADAVGNLETSPREIVGVTTHVDEQTLKTATLVIAPHPADQELNVRSTDQLPIGTYRLVSITGQIVAEGAAELTAHIDTRQLSPGVYHLITERGAVPVVKR